MCQILGCSAMLGAVAFILGLIGSLFAADAGLGERLAIAAAAGTVTFIVAALLSWDDQAPYRKAMRSVRQMLLARDDVGDEDFAAHFPQADGILILQTRQAVAQFFGVPAKKIHPADDLRRDLAFDVLRFDWFVASAVLASRNAVPQPFVVETENLSDIGSLAAAIQRGLAP